MSIPLQAAMQVLQETAPMLDAEEDIATTALFQQISQEKKARRKEEVDEAQKTLQNLSRALSEAKITSTRQSNVPTAQQALDAIDAIEQSSMALAKGINDTQGALSNKQAHIALLKDQIRALGQLNVATELEKDLDGHALRLQVYKGLGFEPVADRDGRVTTVLIRTPSGDLRRENVEQVMPSLEAADGMWKAATVK